MGWLASLALLSCLQGISSAQTHQDVAGEWALGLGKRTLLVLSLRPVSGNSESYTGSLARPTHLTTAVHHYEISYRFFQ